jgi:hypothetical protein
MCDNSKATRLKPSKNLYRNELEFRQGLKEGFKARSRIRIKIRHGSDGKD